MRKVPALFVFALGLACGSLRAQQIPVAIDVDPPTDKQHPAAMESFQLPSHGAQLNSLMYIAAGAGPHPVVILLHGFPGNEKNLDVAQAIRRAGWDVLYFNYRGSWGSPGEFSFSHSAEDVAAALAYLREPANAAKLEADPKRIVLIGHSMGGFMAAYGGSHDPEVMGIGIISAQTLARANSLGIRKSRRRRRFRPSLPSSPPKAWRRSAAALPRAWRRKSMRIARNGASPGSRPE